MKPEMTRVMQFVIKSSKFCNLRCRYCYELKELGERATVSRDQVRRIYEQVAEYYVRGDRVDGERTEVRFIWHGGEPLLLKPAYYWDTFADQREIIGTALDVMNVVQTNLTVLDDERIRLLREGFDKIGVSIDLFGGLRVNTAGCELQDRVLGNMDRLRQERIEFACITVLTRNNLSRIEEVFRFYEHTGLGCRLLPLFDGAYDGQHEGYDITTEEVLGAYRRLVDMWLASDRFIQITPIVEHIQTVLRHLSPDAPRRYYDRRRWVPTLLVNTNGDCYGYGDPYGDPEWSHGNLFAQPLSEILSGSGFERSVRAVEERMAVNCTRCPFFGACDGYPIAEDHSNCRNRNAQGVRLCVLERSLFAYIEQQVRASGLVAADGRLMVDRARAERLGLRIHGSPPASELQPVK